MNISDFDYNLPEEKIAIYPPLVRGNAKLLVLDKNKQSINDRHYSDLADYFSPGDVLIINNTKVVNARIFANSKTNKKIELIFLEKHMEQVSSYYKVLYKGKLKTGDTLTLDDTEIHVENILGSGIAEVSFHEDISVILKKYGRVPIPPYLNRNEEDIDNERYQTLFASKEGSVAAPTASLNFTNELKEKIINKGVHICEITLHVGLGTFLPVRKDDIEKHEMHKEYYFISKDVISKILNAQKNNNKIIALGTTSTRALESAWQYGISDKDDVSGETDIFIYPGYEFKIVDILVTNFHAPRSTVLLMAAAFAGWDNLKMAYNHALISDYKFLSYGDSMIIL